MLQQCLPLLISPEIRKTQKGDHMRTLTLNELDSVSGGASGRDIAMAIGTLSGQFVAGGIGAAAGGVAGGAIYDYG